MNATTQLTWNEGVFLVPVANLPDDVRSRLDPADGEFALTRPQGRNGSKIVDSDAADLVERFRHPHSLVEAVILYSRARGAAPETVLQEALPLVRSLVQTGYLVPLVDGVPVPPAGEALDSRWQAGDVVLDGTVERVLQVLEDTELYLLRLGAGPVRVLKAARRPADADPGTASLLAHEAAVLAALGGGPAPELVTEGELAGHRYLLMEHVAGVELEAEAAVLREATGPAARRGLLRLVTRVAGAYARLHARGVLHGDVHPRNVLVQRDGTVRLIDFGWAWRPVAGDGGGRDAGGRGGVPFFYEPELARAYRLGEPPPPPTPAGEQYAVAVLLYLLVTGAYPRDYPLGRDEMLAEITDLPPLDFRQRGVAPWPALEGALARALAKDPVARHPSLLALAAALEEADEEPAATPAVGRRPRGSTGDPLASVLDACLAAADLGGEWLAAERLAAPSASVNYGAAGVALALLGVAQARRDGHPLALAQVWLERARRDVGTESGFYNDEIEIRRDTVGEASPFHGEAGIHAVAALLARARGDLAGHGEAVDAFLAASERPVNGLDLTLGRSACLLGAALLLDATPEALGDEVAALRAFGDRHLAAIWEALDREPAIPRAAIDYLGIAHGWAGLLYASLTWCAVSGAAPPPSTEGRAAELAALAVPEGRGLTWPWTLSGEGRQSTMPGWCNGSCGYVFLWTLLHRASGDPRYLDLAVGAAWDAWDAPDLALSLCCGLAGRAYALLDLHRATGDAVWLERARALAARGARQGVAQMDGPHALYKGALGLALLAADVERPETARMPLFEPYGYRSGGGRTRVEGVAPIPRHTDAGPPAEGTGTAPPPPLATGS